MDKIQALNTFWSSFGWAAYDAYTVPSEDLHPDIPRITHNTEVSEFEDTMSVSVSLWDESYTWDRISQKADEIYAHIGSGGIVIPFDGGALWIKRGSPFYTRMADPDDRIRRIVINVDIEYFKD